MSSRKLQRLQLPAGRLLAPRPGGAIPTTMNDLIALSETRVMRSDGARGFLCVDRAGRSLAQFNAANSSLFGFRGRWGGLALGDSLKLAASPRGELVILDSDNRRVLRCDRRGWFELVIGGGQPRDFKFRSPIDVAVGEKGRIYVLDAALNRVVRFARNGLAGVLLGSAGDGATELNSCIDLECSGSRRALLVLQDRKDHNIHLMDPNGRGTALPRSPTIAEARAACEGVDLTLWVLNDQTLGSIPVGNAYRETGGEFDEVSDMSVSVTGRIYVVDAGDRVIHILDRSGVRLGQLTNKRVRKPTDLALGDYGRIYVYDASSEKIHLFSD